LNFKGKYLNPPHGFGQASALNLDLMQPFLNIFLTLKFLSGFLKKIVGAKFVSPLKK